MAIDYFDLEKGLQLDGGRVIINVVGAPGTTTSADDAPVGSLALSDNGSTYTKATAGAGTDKWAVLGSESSWREPALVKDDAVYANIAAAEVVVNTGTVDGETVVDGSRILYTLITGENKNVFIVTGTPGAGATLVEDSNATTTGDTLYIEAGTEGGKTFTFNGTLWVQSGGTALDELGYIRAFIGKTAAGSELPTYSSVQVIAQNDNLEVAIGKLDAVANVPKVSLGNTAASTATVDTVLCDEFGAATWKIYIQETATQDTESLIVTAAHDGNATNDAAVVKHNVSSKLRLGNVNGADYDVVLNGTGAAQEMQLLVTATNAFDVRVVRDEYIDFSVV
jgi:hypothetical protein